MTEPDNTTTTAEVTPEAIPTAPATEPQETGADPAPVSTTSELQAFRANRKAERDGDITPESAPAEPTTDPEPVAQADGDATTQESAAEVVSADDEAPKADDPSQFVDPDTGDVLSHKKRSGRRIMSLLRKQHELKSEIEALQNRNETLQSSSSPTNDTASAPTAPAQTADGDDPAPVIAQFKDESEPYAAWIAANAAWTARQEFKKQAAAQSQSRQSAQFEAAVAQAQNQWDTKSNDPEFRKVHPDFDEKYNIVYTSLPTDGKQRPLVGTLLKSPIGHEIMYHLGNHPEKIAELYQAPTLEVHQRMIGKLEAQVEAALNAQQPSALTPVASTTPPSAPMAPVGGTATPTNYDARTATLAQHRKHYGVRGGRRRS